jgi:hypothetical protein
MVKYLLTFNKYSNLLKLIPIVILFFIVSEKSYSIPAFARKYKTSCTTCHIAVSKRNAFGEAFRRNGYVMTKRNEKLIKEQPLKLGAEAWKEMWPDAIWPSDIPGQFPIAAVAQMRMEYDVNPEITGHQFDFNMPFDFNFVYGGAFGEDVGFFGNWSSVFGFGRMFFVLNDLIGPKDIFNLKIGLFPLGVADGYPDNQRLTMERTNIMGTAVAGDWVPNMPQAGLEINGILEHRFQYFFGIVNGENRTRVDINDNKDLYARVAYKIGGSGLDGEGLMTDSVQTDEITDNSLTIGVYSYYGNSQKTEANTSFNNAFNRFGFDLRFQQGNFDLLIGAMTGKDNRPQLNNKELNSLLSFVEADYTFFPWLIGIARLEYQQTEITNSTSEVLTQNSNYRLILNLCALFRQNIRFSLENLTSFQGEQKIGENTISPDNSKPVQWVKLNGLFAF